jgi:hypothetical protein
MMVGKEEIREVIDWCEKVKKERGVMFAIERNPFRDRMGWTARFPLIEIDRPMESAGENNLVYDSTMGRLYQNFGGKWMEVVPDVGEGIGGDKEEKNK